MSGIRPGIIATILADPATVTLKRLAWAYGCARRGSSEEDQLGGILESRLGDPSEMLSWIAGQLASQAPTALARISESLRDVPENTVAWTYTILGFDRSKYLTRTLLPRAGGRRPLIHNIHRDDLDPHPHNHPWNEAHFAIAAGGYTEERDGVRRILRPGDVNRLLAGTFHRVTDVLPDTWTIGLAGERVQDWGFLVDGAVVPHAEYFARKGHVIVKSEGKS